jgi:CRP-like cAMP-binding protein
MTNILKQYIISQLGDDIDNLEYVLSKFQCLKVKRNSQLLTQGEICKYVYFVAEGCLQSYIYDTEMTENTREIVTEGNWYSDLRSFNKGVPAIENIRAIEPSLLYQVNNKDFQEMIETIPQFGKVYQKILEAYYTNAVYRVNTFISLSALDRMKWLLQQRPDLMTRLPSKIIASYLGINKDVFSRLKAKL